MECDLRKESLLAALAHTFIESIGSLRTGSSAFTTGSYSIPSEQIYIWLENRLLEKQSELLDDASELPGCATDHIELGICETYSELLMIIRREDQRILEEDGSVQICLDSPADQSLDKNNWNRCFHCGADATLLYHQVGLCTHCRNRTKQAEHGTLDEEAHAAFLNANLNAHPATQTRRVAAVKNLFL